jgi:hypothetical protein
MKVSMNINQHIEAESFPSFPASRRSREASAASVARWHGLDDPPRQCPPTSVNVRQCPEQPLTPFHLSPGAAKSSYGIKSLGIYEQRRIQRTERIQHAHTGV